MVAVEVRDKPSIYNGLLTCRKLSLKVVVKIFSLLGGVVAAVDNDKVSV